MGGQTFLIRVARAGHWRLALVAAVGVGCMLAFNGVWWPVAALVGAALLTLGVVAEVLEWGTTPVLGELGADGRLLLRWQGPRGLGLTGPFTVRSGWHVLTHSLPIGQAFHRRFSGRSGPVERWCEFEQGGRLLLRFTQRLPLRQSAPTTTPEAYARREPLHGSHRVLDLSPLLAILGELAPEPAVTVLSDDEEEQSGAAPNAPPKARMTAAERARARRPKRPEEPIQAPPRAAPRSLGWWPLVGLLVALAAAPRHLSHACGLQNEYTREADERSREESERRREAIELENALRALSKGAGPGGERDAGNAPSPRGAAKLLREFFAECSPEKTGAAGAAGVVNRQFFEPLDCRCVAAWITGDEANEWIEQGKTAKLRKLATAACGRALRTREWEPRESPLLPPVAASAVRPPEKAVTELWDHQREEEDFSDSDVDIGAVEGLLKKRGYPIPWVHTILAKHQAARGNIEEALASLEHAVDAGYSDYPSFLADVRGGAYRLLVARPRFEALARRLRDLHARKAFPGEAPIFLPATGTRRPLAAVVLPSAGETVRGNLKVASTLQRHGLSTLVLSHSYAAESWRIGFWSPYRERLRARITAAIALPELKEACGGDPARVVVVDSGGTLEQLLPSAEEVRFHGVISFGEYAEIDHYENTPIALLHDSVQGFNQGGVRAFQLPAGAFSKPTSGNALEPILRFFAEFKSD